MYNWHGSLHPPPAPPPTHTHTHPHPHPHPHTLAAPSSTAYPVSSVRWLPAVRHSGSGNGTGSDSGTGSGSGAGAGAGTESSAESTAATATTTTTTGDTISNLRMGQNSNHQPVSVVETPRGNHARGRAPAGAPATVPDENDMDDEGSESDSREDATGEPGAGTGTGTGAGTGRGSTTATGAANGSDRKHGKRLTTKEEVSLFDICNRHAHEFGQRSNLCKWWITVTTEFTHDQGHPYSWHSVRRKVEMVTKQRMKFLEELREKTGVDPGSGSGSVSGSGSRSEDLSNPRWRAAVDAWIPTWQRWEVAEARRIEKRDSRKTRKRKRQWDFSTWDEVASGLIDQGQSHGHGQDQAQAQAQAQVQPQTQVQIQAQGQDTARHPRLPPGFDSMFSPPNPSSRTPIISSPAQPSPGPSPGPSPRTVSQSSPRQPSAGQSTVPGTGTGTGAGAGAGLGSENMMSAILETLGKLNRRLEAEPTAAPVTAGAGAGAGAVPSTSPMTALQTLKEELRRELRVEIRREIEQDRASLEKKLDSVQKTQDTILRMLRQE